MEIEVADKSVVDDLHLPTGAWKGQQHSKDGPSLEPRIRYIHIYIIIYIILYCIVLYCTVLQCIVLS